MHIHRAFASAGAAGGPRPNTRRATTFAALSPRQLASSFCMLLFFAMIHLSVQQDVFQAAWMAGSSTLRPYPQRTGSEPGAPPARPASRRGATGWFDSTSREIWIFGGRRADIMENPEFFNDLWKYKIADNLWTRMTGNDSVNLAGTYGLVNVSSPLNTPGSRQRALGWFDPVRRDLWLFGGHGRANDKYSLYNDLWRYRISEASWTWVAGANLPPSQVAMGKYGEQGVSHITNAPGSRQSGVSWFDPTDRALWMFGGLGFAASGYGNLNDLWRWKLDQMMWTWMGGANTTEHGGVYGSLGVASTGNLPRARADSIGWYDPVAREFWLFGGPAPSGTGYLNDLWRYGLADGTWAWISGSSTPNQPGSYGIQGTSLLSNVPGGRIGSIGWFDPTNQELILFGGYGLDSNSATGYLNDLWRFSVKDSGWTWMAGNKTVNQNGLYDANRLSDSSHIPGAAAFMTSVYDPDSRQGWLFGGFGYKAAPTLSGFLDDLWGFEFHNGAWERISGSESLHLPAQYGELNVTSAANTPGARVDAASYYDHASRELWLFGGVSFDPATAAPSYYQDLWKFSVDAGAWTWIAGSTVPNQPPIYGSRGVPATSNSPGGRKGSAMFYDAAHREIYLFGGVLNRANSILQGSLNCLWRFRLNESSWTWLSGSTTTNQAGSFGTIAVPTATNVPSSREDMVSWYDATTRQFWIFGGTTSASRTAFSDLWRYRVEWNDWTWMGGPNMTAQFGVYGIQGEPHPNNMPGSRFDATSWYDASSRELWLFGGSGAAASATGVLNDLWRYRMSEATWTWMSGSNQRDSTGTLSMPGSRRDAAGWFDPTTGTLWLFGGHTVVPPSQEKRYLNDLWRYQLRTGNWELIAGSAVSTYDSTGSFGEIGVFNATSMPASRGGATTWFDQSLGQMWLFGGNGFDSTGAFGSLNDLWRFTFGPLPPADSPISGPPLDGSAAPVQTDNVVGGSQSSLGLIVGCIVGAIFAIGIIVAVILVVRYRKRSSPDAENNPGTQPQQESSQSVEMATVVPAAVNTTNIPDNMFSEFTPEWMIPFAELKFNTKLGQGGFGMVYSGRWRGGNVAIKQSTVLCVEENAISDLKREALLMLQLRPHPNCVQMLGICVDNTNVYVVMELCSRGSLDSLLRNGGGVSLERKLRIIAGIAAGVWNLHHHGIVHRDLAARNILLGTDDVAKVSDFGMSRMVDQFERQGITNSDVGPIRWMAPESIDRRVYSPKSDVWAWANTVVEILNEKEPYYGMTLATIIPAIVSQGLRPQLDPAVATCPEWLWALLDRCWSMDPNARPSMDEINSIMEQNAL